MARKHKMDEVLSSLSRKHDIRIDVNVKTVEVLTGKSSDSPSNNDLGNKSWGKIDYLRNYCGYTLIFVDRFNKKY
jgi:hypothetical protein